MKKPDEIKKGLECALCDEPADICGEDCPCWSAYSPAELLQDEHVADALAYIQQLEKEKDDLLEERELNDYLRDRVKRLESQGPRWISVEERLPSEHISVAVYIDEGAGCYWIQTAYLNGGKWRIPGEFVVDRNITHWMPLPEHPKE